MDKLDFMRRAIELAAAADPDDGPFGSVVVLDGEIVGEGVNLTGTRPDPSAHAEVEAIRNAAMRLERPTLEGCELYTSCEPCPMCAAAIHWAGIDKVYYAASVEDAAPLGFEESQSAHDEVARHIGDRARPAERLLADEGLAAMRDWVSRNEP